MPNTIKPAINVFSNANITAPVAAPSKPHNIHIIEIQGIENPSAGENNEIGPPIRGRNCGFKEILLVV